MAMPVRTSVAPGGRGIPVVPNDEMQGTLTFEVGPTQTFSGVLQLRQLSDVELTWVLTYRIGRV